MLNGAWPFAREVAFSPYAAVTAGEKLEPAGVGKLPNERERGSRRAPR
jgi:hypothetical protein